MESTLGSVSPLTMFGCAESRTRDEGLEGPEEAFLVQFQTLSETYCITNGLEDLI